ncbi:MAG: DUF429 domain-containing protein [Planctomycetota bacterium]
MNERSSSRTYPDEASQPRKMRGFIDVEHVFGIDFSGAAQAGNNAWLAKLHGDGSEQLVLKQLKPLRSLAGNAARAEVCRYLVDRIRGSGHSIWGMDFPFGLPIELGLVGWTRQLQHVAHHEGDAKSYGRRLVDLSEQRSGKKHVRRATDLEQKTPFDCYHYRIIYQTFHGMRDVLAPLQNQREIAVLPFQYSRANHAQTIVVEACPSSTLKRLQLPHQRYKQSGSKPPSESQRLVRRRILAGLRQNVVISPYQRSVIMNNPGGDALDAVLAGYGAWQALLRESHAALAKHPRYPREGYVYC